MSTERGLELELVGMTHPVQNGSNKAGVRTGSGRLEM